MTECVGDGVYVSMGQFLWVSACLSVRVFVRVCVQVCVCARVSLGVCVSVCVGGHREIYVCVYIYMCTLPMCVVLWCAEVPAHCRQDAGVSQSVDPCRQAEL